MGAACCVAAKGRNVTPGAHCSPSWSFRWDNRGRVAGDGGCGNGVKFSATVEAPFDSEEGSPLDSFSSLAWQKSPVSETNDETLRLRFSDQANSQNIVEIKESMDSPSISYPYPLKLSPSVPSVSSKSASSPLSFRSHLLPSSSTPLRRHYRSPRHQLLRQVSDSIIPEHNRSPSFSISEEPSLFSHPLWGNESTRGSNGGSSDSCPFPVLPEILNVTNRRERWSFDSEISVFSQDKTTRHNSGSPFLDQEICGVCTKLLTDRSSLGWGGQKIMYTNQLAVVSVLICGHVYHSECLEYMTSEINKYDPACPVCTMGEKEVRKMSEKAVRAELESKARKRSRNRVVDSDLSGEIMFDHPKSGVDGRVLKLGSSSSMKSSTRKPFLRSHFSFGSKTSKSFFDRQVIPRRGFSWARSSKDKGSLLG